MKTVIIIDGNHLMHRAYWAIQRTLSTSSGEQVNTVFGVASMMLSLYKKEKPDMIVVCFDEGSETFRHKEYKEYKEGRAETPDDFYEQIPKVYEFFDAFSIPTISNPTYEADDLIGTLAVQARDKGYSALVVSGDKDLFQLADTAIRIVIPHKGYGEPEYLDAKGVEAKLGVSPEKVPDFKGLVGDPSDNLKGVHGIGPKTAVGLISTYKDLEGIYEHLADIRPSVRAKLEEDKESAFFCKRMARLVLDVPIEKTMLNEDFCPNAKQIEEFFRSLDFHMLIRRFQSFLKNDPWAQSHFSHAEDANFIIDDPVDIESKDRMTEDQLPLFD